MDSNNHGRKSNRNSRRDRAIAVDISLRRKKVDWTITNYRYDFTRDRFEELGVDDSTIRYDITALKNKL